MIASTWCSRGTSTGTEETAKHRSYLSRRKELLSGSSEPNRSTSHCSMFMRRILCTGFPRQTLSCLPNIVSSYLFFSFISLPPAPPRLTSDYRITLLVLMLLFQWAKQLPRLLPWPKVQCRLPARIGAMHLLRGTMRPVRSRNFRERPGCNYHLKSAGHAAACEADHLPCCSSLWL
jgi:hypothetical protein